MTFVRRFRLRPRLLASLYRASGQIDGAVSSAYEQADQGQPARPQRHHRGGAGRELGKGFAVAAGEVNALAGRLRAAVDRFTV